MNNPLTVEGSGRKEGYNIRPIGYGQYIREIRTIGVLYTGAIILTLVGIVLA